MSNISCRRKKKWSEDCELRSLLPSAIDWAECWWTWLRIWQVLDINNVVKVIAITKIFLLLQTRGACSLNLKTTIKRNSKIMKKNRPINPISIGAFRFRWCLRRGRSWNWINCWLRSEGSTNDINILILLDNNYLIYIFICFIYNK